MTVSPRKQSLGLASRLVNGVLAIKPLANFAKTRARKIRILLPGGHLAIMDMNPRSQTFIKMPPYILTLLKSTEPYLDQYFDLDFEKTFILVNMGLKPRPSGRKSQHVNLIKTLHMNSCNQCRMTL